MPRGHWFRKLVVRTSDGQGAPSADGAGDTVVRGSTDGDVGAARGAWPGRPGIRRYDAVFHNVRWQSIFRSGYPNTPRNQMLAIATNVFLHLHPTRLHRTHVKRPPWTSRTIAKASAPQLMFPSPGHTAIGRSARR